MATSAYAGESATYRAAKDIENRIKLREAEGASHQEAELKGVEEFAIECSIVKVYGSEVLDYVVDENVQIHGGMGYAEESPVSRYFLDARVLSIFEGAEETLALKVIARSLIDSV